MGPRWPPKSNGDVPRVRRELEIMGVTPPVGRGLREMSSRDNPERLIGPLSFQQDVFTLRWDVVDERVSWQHLKPCETNVAIFWLGIYQQTPHESNLEVQGLLLLTAARWRKGEKTFCKQFSCRLIQVFVLGDDEPPRVFWRTSAVLRLHLLHFSSASTKWNIPTFSHPAWRGFLRTTV